ncbi:S-adenosyl-L-methionine-dependent methyltransferase [Xylogone sp. PMI_703]|nr:S-adenosyl-L-methionine-dependent methyltransferase [Xylogone sp. PMI_703]
MTSSNQPGMKLHPLHDSLVLAYDTRAAIYDTEPNSFHLRLARDFIQWASPCIPNTLRNPTSILDLCCGTGMVSLAALDHFGTDTVVHGVDFSAASLALMHQKLITKGVDIDRIKLFQGSATQLGLLPIEKGQYSLITCCSALVLLPEKLDDHIREWATYLKPGGLLIFDVPAYDTQVITDFLSKAVAPYGVPTINRDWIKSVESIKQLIIGSGMAVHDAFQTGVYKVIETQLRNAFQHWEGAVNSPIYNISRLTEDERKDAKEAFLTMMKERSQGGILRDEYTFYIGIARKE